MAARQHQIIHIQPAAPPKPPEGQPCNGCGVCCLSEPCPIGMLLSRRRHGACTALRWSEPDSRYVCGMLVAPLRALGWRGAGNSRFANGLAHWLTRVSARWISAGSGCDSKLEVSKAPDTPGTPGKPLE
ncbi:MAG: hypothetical protein IV107_15405 [Paucibacter sp.]|nr:hypothetical protein [Roseateles sp.]